MFDRLIEAIVPTSVAAAALGISERLPQVDASERLGDPFCRFCRVAELKRLQGRFCSIFCKRECFVRRPPGRVFSVAECLHKATGRQ